MVQRLIWVLLRKYILKKWKFIFTKPLLFHKNPYNYIFDLTMFGYICDINLNHEEFTFLDNYTNYDNILSCVATVRV
jgi:hypothetical protein